MAQPGPARPIGLATELREATRRIHAQAEKSLVMRRLMQGQLARPAYCLLLRNLHAIYSALEAAMDRHAADPAVAAFWLPGLRRCGALEEDLVALHGPWWSSELELQPAARNYAARLGALGNARADLLPAHAYVRYLGDVSGGRLLEPVVARSIGLGGNTGTAFYRFGTPEETRALTRAFRAALEAVGARDPRIPELVAEARSAFDMHLALFDELASAAGFFAEP